MGIKQSILGLTIALALTGCVTDGDFLSVTKTDEASESEWPKSAPLSLAKNGMRLLEAGDYETASLRFNQALKLDVTNSYIQFLNGLAYHLQAANGQVSLYPLAEEGYKLAIKFDPSNWVARHQMGLLLMERRRFREARAQFAEAALFNKDDPGVLYGLAAASYYVGDPATAAAALNQLSRRKAFSPNELRAAAVVNAALGNVQDSVRLLGRYRDSGVDSLDYRVVESRVSGWRRFHERQNRPHLMSQFQESPLPNRAPTGAVEDTPLPPVGDWQDDETDQDTDIFHGPGHDSGGFDLEAARAEDTKRRQLIEAEHDDENMVIVDVVILRTEENISTAKGVNLLSGLTLQFGADTFGTSGLSYQMTRRKEYGNNTETITKAIGLKQIEYALNIANANSARSEILARPSLIALDNEESEFFSGINIDAKVVVGGDDITPISANEDIGIMLRVLPEFLDDGRIKLSVFAERQFLSTPNTTSVIYTFRIDTSKTEVKTNAIMRFGETMILSGLSEKEGERNRDGVPLLQDIPGVQYLFSRKTTQDFEKSVLILLTPRRPNYIYRSETSAAAGTGPGSGPVEELRARYSDWFRPYPNWASVFHHMQDSSLYREFRTGDVELEQWSNQSTLRQRLNKAAEFLYY